jgi:hypothetical protein
LVVQGGLDELRPLGDAGNSLAGPRLVTLLAEQGCLDEASERLRVRADAGDWYAGEGLAKMLATHDRLDELLTEVLHAGTRTATEGVTTVLTRRGELQQATQLRWGFDPHGSIATPDYVIRG